MGPDVASLGVDPEYGGETFSEAGQRWTVAFLQEVVILIHDCVELFHKSWQVSLQLLFDDYVERKLF